MRDAPGLSSGGATRPRWRISFPGANIADADVTVQRVGQRRATVTVRGGANASQVGVWRAAFAAGNRRCTLSAAYGPGAAPSVQWAGWVQSVSYRAGQLVVEARDIDPAWWPVKVASPDTGYTHLPAPGARIRGPGGDVRVPSPRPPVA